MQGLQSIFSIFNKSPIVAWTNFGYYFTLCVPSIRIIECTEIISQVSNFNTKNKVHKGKGNFLVKLIIDPTDKPNNYY